MEKESYCFINDVDNSGTKNSKWHVKKVFKAFECHYKIKRTLFVIFLQIYEKMGTDACKNNKIITTIKTTRS